MIRLSPIRVVGPDNEQLGVLETADALRMAEDMGLDLVEVVPDSRPPVCRIMDYGKFKYEQSKQEKSKRGNQPELKEVRLGRSIKIDPHDVKIRVDQARRFLLEGHKVQIVQVFRGREMMHRNLAEDMLRAILDQLSDISKVEMAPKSMGRRTSLIVAPDRPKVEAYKRKLEKEKAAAERAAREKPAAQDAPAPAEGDAEDKG